MCAQCTENRCDGIGVSQIGKDPFRSSIRHGREEICVRVDHDLRLNVALHCCEYFS